MIISSDLHKSFILGGNAKVVFHNPKTGNSLTFKIKQSKDNNKLFFVSAFSGNEYQYIGIIQNDTFKTTPKSKFSADSQPVKGFDYVFKKVVAGSEPGVQIQHCGKCSKCAKELTDPISIQTGFGPVCFKSITGKTFAEYYNNEDKEFKQALKGLKKGMKKAKLSDRVVICEPVYVSSVAEAFQD